MTKKYLDSYLIAYPLFCNSKKFSLRKYLSTNNNVTYKDFKKFLINKSVQPPSEEYFKLVKTSVEKDIAEAKEKLQEKVETKNQKKRAYKKRAYKKRRTKKIEENTDE